MSERAELSGADRDLLRKISAAAFANPFGAERWELDAEIAGVPPDDPEIVERVVAVTEAVFARLAPSVRAYRAEDADLVEHALLFLTFHRFADPLDAFIARQAGEPEPLAFPGHADLAAALVERGWPRLRVGRALELFYQLRRAYGFIAGGLVGPSAPMRRLRAALWDAVFTRDVRRYERHLWDRMEDFSTLLLGETGTGKGAAAAALGRSGFIPWEGERFAFSFEEAFVPLNLSEYAEALLESELFGHEKGAFTGAIARHEGAFARCRAHGTIFLDEIGEVSVPTQIKLLRVLQERAFTPVGSHRAARFEGRVVAATNRALTMLRAEGRFRDDFYYRLCSHVIEVPPLRARLEDEPAELDALLGALVERIVGDRQAELEAQGKAAIARDLPTGYGWPGNVRELEQTVRRVLLTGATAPDPASLRGPRDPAARFWARADAGELDAGQLLAGWCALLHRRLGTYAAVAERTALDRRTVKKHVLAGEPLLSA